MIITAATIDDAPGIAAVHVRSWRAAYAGIVSPDYLAALSIDQRAGQWRDVLRKGESRMLVARAPSGIAGFASFGHWRDDSAAADHGEVWALYAHPEAWGTGVGRALLGAAVEELRAAGRPTVSLWVLAANARALRFYETCGFSRVPGSAKSFDLGSEQLDEVMMRRQPEGDA